MSKGSAGRKGQLVEGRAKLRLEIPEMDEPTPLVSMLDSISSLRMSTAGSSEPTTEQLLRDYKSLGGISRDRSPPRSRGSSLSSPLRNGTPASVGLRTSRTVDPAWEKTAGRELRSRVTSRLGSRGADLSGEESDGTDFHISTPGKSYGDLDSPSRRQSPAGKRTSRLQLVTPDLGPGKRSVACGGTPKDALAAISASREGYPDLTTERREKTRKTRQEVDTRKATKEQKRAAKGKLSDTGLFEEAFELAESLLRSAEKYSNRIESGLYGGSNGLTFPCVHKDRDDAVEFLPPAKGVETGKSKWDEASKARAVGVVAMDQLIGRLQKTNAERDVLDKKCTELEEELKHLHEAHSVLLGKQHNFASEMAAMEKRVRQAERTADQKTKKMLLEISRLQKSMSDLKARCETLTDEKETLQASLADADEEVKKARASEKEMSDELEKRRMKEKENAARMQTLVSENAKLVMEHERIEHEMELMGGDLAKAQSRIETLEEQYETCVRENQEKLRALNEKLLGQLRTSEALSSERLSQVNELTKTLEETSVDLKSAKERLLMLEEELKRTKLGAHDLHQEMDIKISEVHSLKMKNKWAFMITTFIIQSAFPHNTDQLVQTEITPLRDIAINTDMPTTVSAAERHWSMVCRAAERLDLAGVDISNRKTVHELFAFISDTVSKKMIVDAVDDKAHQKRQTLPEYLGTWYLEETKSKEVAFANETILVANVRYWIGVATNAKQDSNKNKKGNEKRKSLSKEKEEEQLKLLQCLPRLKTFARFLALEGEGGAEVEHLPLDALNVYLALLIKIRKGCFPLLPEGCIRVSVKTADVLEAIDFVFYRIKSHERMAIRNVFQRDVSMGKQDVDLDNALNWLLNRYMESIFNTVDDRLASLFVAHDRDGDGNLDFEEYFGMIKKLRNDQKDTLSLRQLVRLYGAMMLSPMVDAPIFVRIARENNLCAFVAGPPADEAKIEHERFKKMGALWSILEPYLVAYGRKHQEDADGLRVHQDQVTVKQLLREKLHPDDLHHYIKFLQRKLGLEALEVPEEEPADGKRRGKGGKVKKAALNVLSPEEMFGKFEEESAGPKIIVQKSLIEGLEVTNLTASTAPPPSDTFPEVDEYDDGYESFGSYSSGGGARE